jgi:hypothetical protein
MQRQCDHLERGGAGRMLRDREVPVCPARPRQGRKIMPENDDKFLPSSEHAETDSTLLPMLIAGLVLIVVGAVIVMAFV